MFLHRSDSFHCILMQLIYLLVLFSRVLWSTCRRVLCAAWFGRGLVLLPQAERCWVQPSQVNLHREQFAVTLQLMLVATFAMALIPWRTLNEKSPFGSLRELLIGGLIPIAGFMRIRRLTRMPSHLYAQPNSNTVGSTTSEFPFFVKAHNFLITSKDAYCQLTIFGLVI